MEIKCTGVAGTMEASDAMVSMEQGGGGGPRRIYDRGADGEHETGGG